MTQAGVEKLSVTVVVSVYNEEAGIENCVRSLWHQCRPPESIIAVDDGSTDATARVLADLAAIPGHPDLHVLTMPRNRGVPAARNLGVAQSSDELIAFLDADARAPEAWLGELIAPFADPAVAVVGGPDQAPPGGSPFSRAVDYSLGSWIGSGRLRQRNPFAPLAPGGCNLAVRRADFVATRGFDERLDRRGEEKELLQRLRRAGRRIVFNPKATVWHQRRLDLCQFWRQNYLSGRARVDILRLAPDAFAWPYLVPAAIVLLLGLAALGVLPTLAVLGGYLAALLLDGGLALRKRRPWRGARWVPLTTATIHLGYGSGLWMGALRWLTGGPLGSGAIRERSRLPVPAGREAASKD